MPFVDNEKKKAYYHSHKKHYDRDWVNKNRAKWRVYVADYNKNQRRKVAQEIKRELLEINLAEENSLSFKAAVIFLLIAETKILHFGALVRRTGYLLSEVRTIFANWKKCEIFKDGKFYLDESETSCGETLEVTLIAMCGAGILNRITVP